MVCSLWVLSLEIFKHMVQNVLEPPPPGGNFNWMSGPASTALGPSPGKSPAPCRRGCLQPYLQQWQHCPSLAGEVSISCLHFTSDLNKGREAFMKHTSLRKKTEDRRSPAWCSADPWWAEQHAWGGHGPAASHHSALCSLSFSFHSRFCLSHLVLFLSLNLRLALGEPLLSSWKQQGQRNLARQHVACTGARPARNSCCQATRKTKTCSWHPPWNPNTFLLLYVISPPPPAVL